MIEKLLHDKNILKVIEFGSIVYGTHTKHSDTDYIVVTTNDFEPKQISCGDKDFQFYPINCWEKLCIFNDIKCIETNSCDDRHWLKGEKDNIQIIYDYIKIGFSKTASNSFVKCKKKLVVEKDYNPWIAKKSMFHSLRLIMFGIQIMKYGKIVDFSEANIYYKDIMDSPNDWEYLKEKYQPIYNKLKSKFRLEHSKLK